MNDFDQVLYDKLLELCERIYCPEGTSIGQLNAKKDINKIFNFAQENRLSHYLALECGNLFGKDEKRNNVCDAVILEYNDYDKRRKDAVLRVKKVLNDKPYMVIKTFSSYPHITSDFDVLVQDSETARKTINSIDNLEHNPRDEGADKESESPLEIDINHNISWGGADAISNDFAWNNTQRFTYNGTEFLVPNPPLDTLIRVGHMPFELAQIRLGELLHIYKQASLFDWDVIENESKLMGWPKTFSRISDILHSLHCALFKKPFLKNRPPQDIPLSNIKFPFELPYTLLAQGVIEKGAWDKIYGARFIVKDRVTKWLRINTL